MTFKCYFSIHATLSDFHNFPLTPTETLTALAMHLLISSKSELFFVDFGENIVKLIGYLQQLIFLC